MIGQLCRGRANPLPRGARLRRRALRTNSETVSDVELVKAATTYSKAMEDGEMSEDEVVDSIMGYDSEQQLSDVQLQYREKLKSKIAKKAEDMKRQASSGCEEFDFGVKLYERGRYADSEKMLRTALDISGPFSRLGGDIQIQLALAMNANKKEEECIALFKELEETHPLRVIQKQAENLRFIMEAPKLEIGDDERIQMPTLEEVEDNKGGKRRRSPPPRAGGSMAAPKTDKSWEDEFWENYSPPKYLKNKFVWVATALLAAGSIYYSLLFRDCIPQ